MSLLAAHPVGPAVDRARADVDAARHELVLAGHVDWVSDAADRYRSALAEADARVRRVVHALDELAARVRAAEAAPVCLSLP